MWWKSQRQVSPSAAHLCQILTSIHGHRQWWCCSLRGAETSQLQTNLWNRVLPALLSRGWWDEWTNAPGLAPRKSQNSEGWHGNSSYDSQDISEVLTISLENYNLINGDRWWHNCLFHQKVGSAHETTPLRIFPKGNRKATNKENPPSHREKDSLGTVSGAQGQKLSAGSPSMDLTCTYPTDLMTLH